MSLQECWSYKVHDHCSRKLKKGVCRNFRFVVLYCEGEQNKGRTEPQKSVGPFEVFLFFHVLPTACNTSYLTHRKTTTVDIKGAKIGRSVKRRNQCGSPTAAPQLFPQWRGSYLFAAQQVFLQSAMSIISDERKKYTNICAENEGKRPAEVSLLCPRLLLQINPTQNLRSSNQPNMTAKRTITSPVAQVFSISIHISN